MSSANIRFNPLNFDVNPVYSSYSPNNTFDQLYVGTLFVTTGATGPINGRIGPQGPEGPQGPIGPQGVLGQ